MKRGVAVILAGGALLAASAAQAQKGGVIPDSPVASCWYTPTIGALTAPNDTATRGTPCGQNLTAIRYKCVVKIRCTNLTSGNPCDYCVRLLYGHWDAQQNKYVDDDAEEKWEDGTVNCTNNQDVTIDKPVCLTTGAKLRFTVKAYNAKYADVTSTTAVTASDPYNFTP